MVTKTSLENKKILVTRPQQQASNLVRLIASAQGQAINFPVIDIAFQVDPILEQMQTRWDKVIFISRNAVKGFCRQLTQRSAFENSQFIAVGLGTADEMVKHEMSISIFPKDKGGSEYLLELPEMQDVNSQNILIVRGKGGRELLADSLSERGASVTYAEVYDRVMTKPSEAQCLQAVNADVLLCTSQLGVENLLQILQAFRQQIINKPLVVLSERIKTFAMKAGFQSVYVTASTTDEAVIECIMQMET